MAQLAIRHANSTGSSFFRISYANRPVYQAYLILHVMDSGFL
jgi:hypothetical protein